MQVKVGSFVQSLVAAPSTQSVTGIGFAPRALILWTTGGTVDGAFRAGVRFGIGFVTSPGAGQQAAVAFSANDNVTPTAAGRQAFARAIGISSPTTAAVALARAGLASFDADGFTLNWVVNDAAGYIINYMALGLGVLAKAHTFNVPPAVGQQSITGIGFRPDLVIVAGTLGADVGVAAADAAVSFGAMDGLGGQAAMALYDRSAQNPADTQRIEQADSVIVGVDAAATLSTQAQFSSMDADGYTLSWVNVTAPTPCPLAAIAIQCGGRARVGLFSKSIGAAPATQPVTGVGFTPEGLLLFANQATVVGGSGQARLGIGASSGAGSERSSAMQSANAVIPSSVDAIDRTDRVFVKVNNTTPGQDASAQLASFDTDGFTLTWQTNDAVATQLFYIALAGAIPVGWTYNQIGTAKAGPSSVGLVKGARSYSMTVAAAGDQWSVHQNQDLVASQLYRLSGTYMTGLGNPSTVQAWLELQEVLGPRFMDADGLNFASGGGALILKDTQGELRRFCFDFLAPDVALRLRFGLSSFGGAGELHVDDWRLQPIWAFHFYEPRLALDSLPETEISATSIFYGPKAIGLGRLSLLNHDGALDSALGQLLLFNRQARVLSGGVFQDGQEVYRDDWRTEFLGFLKDMPEASDARVAFDLEDSRAFLSAQLPARAYSLADFGSMDLNKVGYPRPIFLGEALPVAGQSVPYIRPARIDVTADGYGVYEIADAAAAPNGMYADAALSAYETEEAAEKRPGSGFAMALAQATQDLVNGRFTVIDNVKPHRYNAGALIPLHSLDFNIGAGALLRSGELAQFGKDVATAETAAWTAAAGVAISWTYNQTTHKFTVTKGAGTLQLLTATGANKQNSGPAWAALGFLTTPPDKTGALTYTSDNADFVAPDVDHIIQAVSSGFKDDSAGTYTGTPNALIRRGVDMVRVLLQHYLKLPAGQIDPASFAAARAGEGGASCYAYLHRLEQAAAILTRFEATMLADIVVDGEGIVHVVPYKATTSSVRAFTDRDYLSFSVRRRVQDIRTKVRLYYGYDPHLERWSSVEASSPATLGRYGIEQTLEVYTYLSYTGAALNRAADFLALATASPLVAQFSAKGKLVDLKIGDKITLTRARAFSPEGSFEDKVFRVRGLRRNAMTGISKCTAVEDIAL